MDGARFGKSVTHPDMRTFQGLSLRVGAFGHEFHAILGVVNKDAKDYCFGPKCLFLIKKLISTMAGRGVTNGGMPGTYGSAAYRAQASSKNAARPMGKIDYSRYTSTDKFAKNGNYICR